MRYSREEAEFDRAIGFLDATFALALTLLVTTLDVSGSAAPWESLGALDDEFGAQFIAFAISFAVIGHYWLVHHTMVASFTAIDTRVILANLVLIAAVVLIPFATEAVGDPQTENLPLPVAVLAINVAAASALSALVYWLAYRHELLDPPPSVAVMRANLMASLGPAAVFLISIPIAYAISPDAAKLSWLALVVLQPLLGRRIDAARKAG
jgi:uncharacterized membrane protein